MKRALSLLFLIAILAISCTAGGEFEAPAENEDVNTAVTIENLPAKSALLADLSTGRVLYELNPDIQLPPASITKIMTMLLVIERGGEISHMTTS